MRGQEEKDAKEKQKAERKVNLMGKDGTKTGREERSKKRNWERKINKRIP